MTVILEMEPLWGTAETVTALYGLPRARLLALAREGSIRARKLDPNTERKELRAFTVKAHWGLLIRAGVKTCENRSFRVPPGFYLVHASNSLSFSEWCAGSLWVADRFGADVKYPGFDECRAWCGQIVCGVRIVSALPPTEQPPARLAEGESRT